MTDTLRNGVLFGGAGREGAGQAAFASAAVLISLLLSSLLFPVAARGAFRVWVVSPTFNHCFLILPIAIFLIWRRRGQLAGIAPVPDMRAAIAILVLSLIWAVAFIVDILEAQQFVIMTMVQAALFGLLGVGYYRKLAAPFLYLYFLVPSGAYLIPALQAFTARFAVIGLHILAIPVFSNGSVIQIPAGTFAVAEACAGLRFLVAAVAFGVLFSIISYRSIKKRLAFSAVSIVVPIIANGVRALGLIAAAEWVGSPRVIEADHIIYGWVFFSIVLLILIAVGQSFSDQDEESAGTSRSPVSAAEIGAPVSRFAAVAGMCFLAAVAVPLAVSRLPLPRTPALPALPPIVNLPWHSSGTNTLWQPIVTDADRAFLQTFVEGSGRIDRFIAIYGAHGRSANVARTSDRDADERVWSLNSANPSRLDVGNRKFPVHMSTWLRGENTRVVWSFYVIGGRVVTGRLEAKWQALRSYVTGNKCLSAYVALSAEGRDQTAAAKWAGDLLNATEPLAPYLCGATIRR